MELNTRKSYSHKKNDALDNSAFVITLLGLLIALGLAVISYLHLCSEKCAAGHSYRIFGLTFEIIGFAFFPVLIVTHLLSRYFSQLASVTAWLICAALGSEVMFIYVQKYKIGSWCPVCLSIAGALLVAGLCYLYGYFKNLKNSLEWEDKEQTMNNICKGITGFLFFIAGFVFAFTGIAKFDALHAEENSVKQRLVFGDTSSPIEVYVFTDWRCPGCRSLEKQFEAMAPAVMRKAQLIFVDDPVHPESMNFVPYNISFMINNKPKYFALRSALTKLSQETETPTDQQVEEFSAKLGVQYRQLNYAEVALANKYFAELVDKLKVEGTPTIVVVNKNTKKGKKLEGTGEISEVNVMKAITKLSN